MDQLCLDGFDRPLGWWVESAVSAIRQFSGAGYVGGFSGGKDSTAIKALARMAGVPVEWHYHVTTVDPPELVRYIHRQHPDVVFDVPKWGGLWTRIAYHGVPTRFRRWCCSEYKEGSMRNDGRRILLGVRAAESARRARQSTGFLKIIGRAEMINPIIYWPDWAVWEFIRAEHLPYCGLYDEGFSRLGCVGCPLTRQGQREIEWERWPRIARLWHHGCDAAWSARQSTRSLFPTPADLWDWWAHHVNDRMPELDDCQMSIFGEEGL